MEDLAQAGGGRFELTMLAEREAFEANLGREDPEPEQALTDEFRA